MRMGIQTLEKKTYSGIDLVKLICAILIVWLHATETNDVCAVGIQYVFTRFCVPFFFICSGYFLCSGLQRAEDGKAYFINYEKRLLLLFLFYGVLISGPIVVMDYIRNNPDSGPLRLTLLIIRRVFVIGNGAYWYLVSLIFSTAFLYLCDTKKWDKLLIGSVAAGFVLQVGYTSFDGIIQAIPLWTRFNDLIYFIFSWESNFIMCGIPFCGIGWLIRKHRIDISKRNAWIGFCVFTVLRTAEYMLPQLSSFWQENSFSILHIPQAVMLFFAARHCKGIPGHAKTFRQLSSFIYFVHWIILYNILDPLMLNVFGMDIYSPVMIPVKTGLTLAICLALNWMLKRTNNQKILFLIGG